MAIVTINGSANADAITSNNSVYATARTGGTTSLLGAGDARVGQRFSTPTYSCYETLIEFDSTGVLASGDTITSATLRLYLRFDDSTTDFTAEAYISDYGASVTTGDYVSGASLSGLTKVATLATSGIGSTGAYKSFVDVALPANVVKNGKTRILIASDRHAAATTPTGNEYLTFYAYDVTNPPKLDITYNPATSYSTEVMADSPTLFFRTDEASGNLLDGSSHGLTGTVSGSALSYQQAGPGTGLPYGVKFNVDGTSLVSITSASGINLGDGPFTIEFWMKRVETGVSRGWLRKYSATNGYRVQVSSSNDMRLQIGSGTNHVRTTAADTDTSGWHHWVLVHNTADGNLAGRAYRDGVDDTTVSSALTFGDNSDPLELNPSGVNFTGYIAGLAIYKTALSSARVLAHYNAAGAVSSARSNRRGMLSLF